MQIDFKTDRKNEVEFVVKGADHGFANLLVSQLLKDEEVQVAQYSVPHPLTGSPVFYLKTRRAPAREVLEKKVKAIRKDLKEIL